MLLLNPLSALVASPQNTGISVLLAQVNWTSVQDFKAAPARSWHHHHRGLGLGDHLLVRRRDPEGKQPGTAKFCFFLVWMFAIGCRS